MVCATVKQLIQDVAVDVAYEVSPSQSGEHDPQDAEDEFARLRSEKAANFPDAKANRVPPLPSRTGVVWRPGGKRAGGHAARRNLD